MDQQSRASDLTFSGPSPCDDCPYFRTCQIDHKACLQFNKYVKTGVIDNTISKHPTFEYYDSVFSSGDRRMGFHVINSDVLYGLYEEHWAGDKKSLLLHKISKLYESCVDVKIDPIVADISTSWEWAFCVTSCPSVVVGAVGWSDIGDGLRDVSFLYVRKGYKKKGIGKMLMNEPEDEARAVFLSPEPGSIKFYERLGYEEVPGTKKLVYRKETERKA